MVYRFNVRGGRHYCLGKQPARPNAIKFKLGNYLDLDRIHPPVTFGHVTNREEPEWLQLGNDLVGDCVVAGAMHETMLWTRAAKRNIARFTQGLAFKEYAAASGWNGEINDASDTGLDMQKYAARRQKVGVTDTAGVTHTVKAYAAIDGAVNLIRAAWVFGAVGLGLRFPDSASKQFEQGVPWSPVGGAKVVGGHYVPVVGRNSRGNIICVTWGRLQAMTPSFISLYMDEAVAYVSRDYLRPIHNVTPEMLNEAQLDADLHALAA